MSSGMSDLLWRLGALACGAAGLFLLSTDGSAGGASLSLAILLLMAALAAVGVLFGGGGDGSADEDGLDLSARLGLGLLGGLLGAAVSAGARSIVAEIGSIGALSMGLTSGWTGAAFLSHLGSGAVWGLMLGVLYTRLPGSSPTSRGAFFSLVPTFYVIVTTYAGDPAFGLDLEALPLVSAGALYVLRGVAAVVSVLAVNAVWGAIAGATLGWGEAGDEAPVARPIDA